MCEFEEKVLTGLKKCDVDFSINSVNLGVAVSGGADSVSLLISLSVLQEKFHFHLFVVSVNHNIRAKEESSGDVEFVENLCKDLRKKGGNLHFEKKEIPCGKVQNEANIREQGIEDAARKLRYDIFEDFISKNSIDYLCLAHNQNDQIETLLMRFLQGSSLEASSGIAYCREKYIRPLLDITRTEIENYLNEKKISWRTDSTNFDTKYFRNKIRHKLVPFLDSEFPGWKTAVLNGGKKAKEQSDFVSQFVEDFEFDFFTDTSNLIETGNSEEKSNQGVKIPLSTFKTFPTTIKLRILLKACNLIGENKRIPYVFLQDVLDSLKSVDSLNDENKNQHFEKQFGQVCISCKKNALFVKKTQKIHTDLHFFDIIEESGTYLFPFGELKVLFLEDNTGTLLNGILYPHVKKPFIIRNCQIGDEIKTADNSFKKIVDIFSDWHVEQCHKELIPIIVLPFENEQPIVAILGNVCNYKDWIVK